MTIHAYTSTNGPSPAYVNLSESGTDTFALTVRSQGAEQAARILLTREQLLNLVNDACVHLDADFDEQANKNKSIVAERNYEAEARRAQVLDMALRTPNLVDYHEVLAAAEAYLAHITGEAPAVVAAPTGPDIALMVSRFLGWKLPDDFCPDAGVSFNREYAAKWGMPSGTNLLPAEQARAMFEYVLRDE